MALSLTAAFTRESSKSGATPTFLVNIGGLTNGKFVKAPRNVLGYPASVKSINTHSSSIDPVTGDQTLSSVTVEFIDDGIVRGLAAANRLIGKDLTVTIGFDTGIDSGAGSFLETDYAAFSTGIIERLEFTPTTITIIAKDARSAIWKLLDSAVTIPNQTGGPSSVADNPLYGQYRAEGAAVVALKQMLLDAGIPASKFSAASFLPANCPATGHLVVDRRLQPDSKNYRHWSSGSTLSPAEPGSDRRVSVATSVAGMAKAITTVLRGTLVVQEDGLIAFSEHDAAAASTFRFVATDIIPGSVKGGLDQSNVKTSVQVHSFYESHDATAGQEHRLHMRDTDAGAQTDWSWSDATARLSDVTLTDDWFCSPILYSPGDPGNIAVGDTVLTGVVRENDNFTGQGFGSPNAVSAALPMYLYVNGRNPATGSGADAGEIIKVTKVITNGDGSFTFGDGGSPCVRGQFGTTARGHSISGNVAGPDAFPVIIVDITAIVRFSDQTLKQFKDGAPVIEFKTPWQKYGIQVLDVGNIESDCYLAFGQNKLAVGNAVKFKVMQKDADPEANEITWSFVLLNNPSRTPSLPNTTATHRPGAYGSLQVQHPGLDKMIAGPAGVTAGELANHFTSGSAPATSASLVYSIPSQVIASIVGQIVIPLQSKTATASKDTYLDAVPLHGGLSSWRVTEVANGAAAPAIATGDMRAFKIVSSGAAVTAVTDLRNKQSVDNANLKDHAVDGTKITTGPLVIPSSSVKVTGQMAALITNSDGMPYALIVDRDTTNLLKNPSFEVNATDDWTADANATLSRITTDKVFGTACAKLVRTATAGSFGFHSNGIATLAGANYYCFSGWLKADAGTPTVICQIQGFNGAIWVTEGQVNFGPTTAGWTRFFVTGNLPSATYSQVRASMTSTASVTFYADGLQIEESVRPSSYCDGDMGVGYSWSGTAHNSTSSRVGGTRDLGALEVQAPLSSTANSNPFVIYDNGYVEASSFGGMQFIGSGTAFPNASTVGSLRDNDMFFRTDRLVLYYYNLALAQWLSVQEYVIPLAAEEVLPINNAANHFILSALPPASDGGTIYLTKWVTYIFVRTTNTLASHWKVDLTNFPGTIIDTFDSQSLGANDVGLMTTRTPNSVRTNATDQGHQIHVTKAGATATPGAIDIQSTVHYRLIG